MRILLITDNHTPTGGAEKYFFELKEKLSAMPEHTVFSLGFAETTFEDANTLILKQSPSKPQRLLWQCVFHWPTYRQLKKLLRTFKPDVIHLHNNKQYSSTVLKAIRGYPVVHTTHDFGLICPSAQNIHRDLRPCDTGFTLACAHKHHVKFALPVYALMMLIFLRLRHFTRKTVNAYLAPSSFLTNHLVKAGFTPAYTLPPFLSLAPKHQHSPTPGQFLYAGHLGTHKGCLLLLKEFAIARRANPSLTLIIAGTGPLAASLEKLVQKEGMANAVRFLGWQTNLTPWYQASMAVVFPSIGLESFGLVMTDAMSHARPVIATNRGTCATLITPHENGLLFDPLTPGDLANQMLALAASPDQAEHMGQVGYQKLKGWINNESALAKTIQIYERVSLKKKPQGGLHPEVMD